MSASAQRIRSGFGVCWAVWLVAILSLFTPESQAASTLDRIKRTGKITIAYREASVPFSYLDAQGKPAGYAIDLCHHLAAAILEKLDMKSLTVEYLRVTSTSRIDAIAQGKADLECESTTRNAVRRKRVAFTVPHYVTGARYVVRSGSPIQELHDFDGKRLVSTAATAPLEALKSASQEHGFQIQLVEVPDHVKGIEMVESGQADGFAMDEVLLCGLIATRPDPSKLKIVGKYLTIDSLSIVLPPNDAQFKTLVDNEMKRLIRSHKAEAIYDRWFTQPSLPAGRNLNLPINNLLRDSWRRPNDWLPS